MLTFLQENYEWLRAFHILAVISWMAGLLYLPRLFVYHADAVAGSETSETFKVMERRLLRAIMNPAMIASLIFGGLMIVAQWPDILSFGWFHAKMTFVVLLIASHMAMARWRRAFAEDRNEHSSRFFRYVNEVPTILMIAIVLFVVVEPF
ncbi:protoporphyrinogen oxidase HemJ [Rhodovibrionaceae bacterium A322]